MDVNSDNPFYTISKSIAIVIKKFVKDVSNSITSKDIDNILYSNVQNIFNNVKDEKLFEFYILSNIMTIISLYKKRLPFYGVRNPEDFIKYLIKLFIPNKVGYCTINADNIVNILLNSIESNNWRSLNISIKSTINILYWKTLDLLKYDDFGMISSFEELLKAEYFKEIIQTDSKEDSYELYKLYIDYCFQNEEYNRDIILLDSIMLGEYIAKGAIEDIHRYAISNKNDESLNIKKISSITECAIGKTINDTVEAIPLTRNFHVTAHHMKLNNRKVINFMKNNDNNPINNGFKEFTELKNIVYDIEDLKKVWLNNYDIYPFSMPGFKIDEKDEALFILQDDILKYYDFFNCISYIYCHNYPFVPFQGARGAHIVYSMFAYLSNTSTDKSSLIEVKLEHSNSRRISLILPKKWKVIERMELFFKFAFMHFPYISLYLDHIFSAIIREDINLTGWFDLCLPIESHIFQTHSNEESVIKFYNNPIRMGMKGLSCLGGYVLALSRYSDTKESSVSASIKIAHDYLEKSLELYKNKKIPEKIYMGYLNCIVKYGKESIESYHLTPKEISVRPNFDGWNIIQELLSEVSRKFIITLFIIRSLFSEFERVKVIQVKNAKDEKYKKVIKYLKNYNILYKNNEKIKNIVDKMIKENSISIEEIKFIFAEMINEKSIYNYIEKSFKSINKYFEEANKTKYDNYKDQINLNNMELKSYKNEILGLLKNIFNTKDFPLNNIDMIIEFLAREFTEILFDKIESISYYMGWKMSTIE